MKKLILLIICAGVVFISCGKKGESAPEVKTLTKPVLMLPAQNSICVTGTGQSASQSSIYFRWVASPYADGYDVTIKNLQTGVKLSKTADVNEISVDLPVNVPYSWQVVAKSKSISGTAESDAWKFYSSGPGVVGHAPFPATASQPGDGGIAQSVNDRISLTWVGADVDNDIVDYDIYLGKSAASLSLLKAHVASTAISEVPVTPDVTYYWKIVSRDKQNNMSTSDIFQFRAK